MGDIAKRVIDPGNLFFGSEAEKRLRKFHPTAFVSPGLRGGFAENRFTVSRTPEGQRVLGDLRQSFLGAAEEFRGLRPLVRPGFGRLTEARVKAIRDAERRTIGDLRENLQRRRVLGSSFAQDLTTRARAEFAQQEEQARTESFLGELQLTTDLIGREFEASQEAFQSELKQLNFETGVAANLTTQAQAAIADNLKAQAEAIAAEEAGRRELIGTAIGAFAGFAAFSDRRLKRDVSHIGSISGLPAYLFRYLWEDVFRIGVMADEVKEKYPDAVLTDTSGYMRVNYSALEAA